MDQDKKHTYLGDGLYALDQGFQFELTPTPGGDGQQSVYLDDHVFKAFLDFAAHSRGLKITISRTEPGKEFSNET